MGIVEKNNKIFVRAGDLTTNEITIEWQQMFKQKKEQYYSVPFFNKDKGDEESVLFIQKDWLDKLKEKKTAGEDFTFVVDETFQYGQDKEKTQRWLVFHDKNRTPYQWRFVASIKQKLGSVLAGFAGGIFNKYLPIDIGNIGVYFGDPLRNF
ncbi:uncharacterized protein CTRU02_204878 [Colletotrichum truncatum]|uniref:Uncharacterized protein n=1 Tax=Colletotrichum truncatum TaxID=5467 RepID=A0ACC3Z2F6_COLTU